MAPKLGFVANIEKAPGVQVVIAVKVKHAAVVLISPGSGNGVDDAAAGSPVLGTGGTGVDAKLLYRVDSQIDAVDAAWSGSIEAGQADAVQAEVVLDGTRPGDADLQAKAVVGVVGLSPGDGNARLQGCQLDVVAAVEWQLLDGG